MDGRAESTYRFTVLDTIGGGTSEILKLIIAKEICRNLVRYAG